MKSTIDIAEIERFDGNLFHVTIRKGAEIDLEAAKRLVNATNSMLDLSKPNRGGIYDLSKIAYIHEEARQYLSSGTDVIGHVVGVALISTTFLGKVIGNLFITLGSPRRFDVRFFDNPMRAEHWLRTNLNASEPSEPQASEQKVA